jgi:hypothetical protein
VSLANYSAAVLAASPKVYWELDESAGNPVDSSGGGFDITTITSTPLYQQPGFFAPGSILYPPGARMARNVFSTVVNSWTIEVLAYKYANPVAQIDWIYSCGTPAASNGFAVGVDTTGQMRGVAHNVGLTSLGIAALGNNQWFHLVWQRRASVWEFWINGMIDQPNAGSTTPVAPSGSAFISGTATGTNSKAWQLAHFALYETNLSGDRVRAHAGAANSFSDLNGPIDNQGHSLIRNARW